MNRHKYATRAKEKPRRPYFELVSNASIQLTDIEPALTIQS